jgi:predicted acylesterase/phospholipase RssA
MGGRQADDFHDVFLAEIGEIAARRARLERGEDRGDAFEKARKGHLERLTRSVCGNDNEHCARGDKFDPAMSDLAGLCLSGGGIRSAAFSIGALQALNALKVVRTGEADKRSLIEQMDYMSTVSGGGYAGCAVSAAMMNHGEPFPFPSEFKKDEPPILQHIRDHSNYLFPRGGIREKLKNLAAYLRGVISHVPVLVVAILVPVLATLIFKRRLDDLDRPILFREAFENAVSQSFFALSVTILLIALLGFLFWAAIRSHRNSPVREYKTYGTMFGGAAIFALSVVAFLQLQPRLIEELRHRTCVDRYEAFIDKLEIVGPIPYFDCRNEWIVELNEREAEHRRLTAAAVKDGKPLPERPTSGLRAWLLSTVQNTTVILSALAGLAATLKSFVGFGETSTAGRTGLLALFAERSRQIVYLLAGLALPLAIWVAYLYLTYWGMKDTLDLNSHAPELLAKASQWLGNLVGARKPDIAWLYVLVLFTAVSFALAMDANANSPHNLYRDRLAAAFLRGPKKDRSADSKQGSHRKLRAMIDRFLFGEEIAEETDGRVERKLTDIGNGSAPFHLINAAVNIQASKRANKRGRNAGFFTFSKTHVGSDETGYLETGNIERIEKRFRLSSAMAVSAAAASTAMGSMTMKPLALTLAALNIRLGYWFANPGIVTRFFNGKGGSEAGTMLTRAKNRLESSLGQESPEIKRFHSLYFLQNNPFGYLLKEIFGFMNENGPMIYLTDGGHIENLGLYTLLKRRCKLIIVIDAEADPEMNFGSFVTAQRYARIDLGTRIDLPLEILSAGALATRAELDPPARARPGAPARKVPAERVHAAIGAIAYPDRDGTPQRGVIIYIKSSMTGEENDYICDYARRHRNFPHETTGDQFFSEEQFEAYRALGFHATFKSLSGQSEVEGIARTSLLRKANGNHGQALKDFFEFFEEIDPGKGNPELRAGPRSPAFVF